MVSSIIWIIVIGFIAGIIARLISPGSNKPSGFILTTALGIVGAFLATDHRMVPTWGRGWADRSNRGRDHSASGVGFFRKPQSTKRLKLIQMNNWMYPLMTLILRADHRRRTC
jgi:uncharacterized membrane protein YeaQ/YmgE (transglycosylase-associated protein family)